MSQQHEDGAYASDTAVAIRAERDALINASHERCRQLGLVDSDDPDFSRASSAALDAALEDSRCLLSRAVPVMETLYQQIVNTHNMVILTDARGLILHSCGDADFLRRADEVALMRGVDWSEASKGTNAIGTALATREPTIVHAGEHYLRANHFLTCSCAPVTDPLGRLVGALDISGEQRSFHTHTLALVRMSAQMIENHFYTDMFPDAVCLHFHSRPEFIGTLMEGIAAFTPAGKFLAANASGQFQLGMSLRALQAHTFSSLFGISISTLIDENRRASAGLTSCCMHNGVTVYVRADYSVPQIFTPRFPARRATAVPLEADPSTGPSHLHYLDTGDSQVHRVVTQLNKVIGKDISVLILGETGTGKELLARAIHGDSPRRDGPFVAINCASIPEGLIESELFGYIEGAFTGGRKRGHSGKILGAHGGTLFLDEIGDMPQALQPRLLRVLEERRVTPLGSDKSVPVDLALVCATHRDLRAMIETRLFREDLYYRINGLVVRLPSLRERSDLDVVIHRLLQREGATDVRIDADVMEFFRRFSWPGNVRQLANLLRTAAQMVDEDRVIRSEHLPEDVLSGPTQPPAAAICGAAAPIVVENAGASLEDLEWRAIREALDRNAGNVTATARALGVSRNTIYRRILAQERV